MARVSVVDASALIAYLDPGDAHHARAVEQIAAVIPPLWVHPLTLAEVLVGPVAAGRAEAVLADLGAIGVTVDDTPDDPLVLAELRVSTRYKMPDCCVLAVARRKDAAVISFDTRLSQNQG